MSDRNKDHNFDKKVIDGFGHEWSMFAYLSDTTDYALDLQFSAYSQPIDFSQFDRDTDVAADFGAGSGRWTSRISKHFSLVYAVEPSKKAIDVLKERFLGAKNVRILSETIGSNSIPKNSLDYAMCLGVLHHVPDTRLGIQSIFDKIKPGGIFHCYLYYRLDDKPFLYRFLFSVITPIRWIVSRLPLFPRRVICNGIATIVYLPLVKLTRVIRKLGGDVSNFPLHHYADMPFVMLQNDALDRFGTKLEQRFDKAEISEMLHGIGFDLSTLQFSASEPFWNFVVKKPTT
jgi:SAM-dependent methyltransferase